LVQGDRRPAVGPVSAHDRSQRSTSLPAAWSPIRYRVVSLLGRGGMGELYGADDLKLGQRVALKFLPRNVERTTAGAASFPSQRLSGV
jgi:serine/threonine protein kinase